MLSSWELFGAARDVLGLVLFLQVMVSRILRLAQNEPLWAAGPPLV
jgi:hypothetical protein